MLDSLIFISFLIVQLSLLQMTAMSFHQPALSYSIFKISANWLVIKNWLSVSYDGGDMQ